MPAEEEILRELVKIGSAIKTMGDGMAELLRQQRQPVKNGQAWPIATFATVILSLGVIFTSLARHNGEVSALRAAHQAEVTATLAAHLQGGLMELDDKLQKEIGAARELFVQAEHDSEQRHDTQQRDIDDIRAYFKAPKLRNNHGSDK